VKKWVFLLLLLLSVAPASLVADESNTAKQVSLEVYPKWYSNDNMTIQGNIGVKKLFQEKNWVTYYVKPSVAYALSRNWAVHGGLGFYYTDNQILNNVREWRPFVGLSHFTNFTDKWGISSYLRTEERYRSAMGSDTSSETTRLRLRFRSSYKLNPLSNAPSWHKLTLDLEGFKSYNNDITIEPTYDYETHITLGAERSLSEERKIRFELAWKYKTQATQLSGSDIHTIFFKIQYFPTWGSRFRNRLRDRDIDE
jgi:hypothetical protein